MQSFPSDQPLPVLPLEYERTSGEQAAARRKFRQGILLLAWSYYLGVGLMAIYAVLQAMSLSRSYTVILLIDTFSHVASVLGLVGSWIILGLNWSGQRHATASAQTVRWVKLSVLAVLVLNSLQRDFRMFLPGYSLLNVMSPSLPAQYILRLILAVTSVWVLVQIWGVLRAIEGTGRQLFPWSIGAVATVLLTSQAANWFFYSQVSRGNSRVSFHQGITSVSTLGLILTELVIALMLTSFARSLSSGRALTSG
jgi:hypothetical protein